MGVTVKESSAASMSSVSASMSALVLMALTMFSSVAIGTVSGSSTPAEYLAPHNAARASVGVAPLSWSSDLANYALGYALTQVNQCLKMQHSEGPFGENLFWGSALEDGTEWTAMEAVTMWTDEIVDYDYAENSCATEKMCGHYTQVVWANSTQVGCASVKCNDNNGGDYIICSYNPPGNYIGERPY